MAVQCEYISIRKDVARNSNFKYVIAMVQYVIFFTPFKNTVILYGKYALQL